MRNAVGLLLSMILLSACDVPPRWRGIEANREAVKAVREGQFDNARESLTMGLSDLPLESALHHNLGLVFDGLKNAEDADKSYQVAETVAPTPEQKFYALFNRAELKGRAKKVDEALELYQRALDLNPASKEVKTNIELLIQQQQSGGQGEGQDQKQDPNQQQNQGQGQNKEQDQKSDQEDKQDPKDGKDKDKEPKEPQSSPKYKPREFKGELKESEVRKILGEIRQQEQKIRSEFNRKDVKERPRDKDW